MIIFKLKELIAKKERKEGKRYALETIAKESGVSRFTLTKLTSPTYYTVSTDIIDKLCKYFNCASIEEFVEYIPDQMQVERLLTIRDAKNLKKDIHKALNSLISENIYKVNCFPYDYKEEVYLTNEEGQTKKVDFLIKERDSITTIFDIRYVIYFGIDLEHLIFLQSFDVDKIIIFTFSNTLPADIKQYKFNKKVEFYKMKVKFNDYTQELISIEFEELLSKESLESVSEYVNKPLTDHE